MTHSWLSTTIDQECARGHRQLRPDREVHFGRTCARFRDSMEKRAVVLNPIRHVGSARVAARDVSDEGVGELDLARNPLLLVTADASESALDHGGDVRGDHAIRFLLREGGALHEPRIDPRELSLEALGDQRFVETGYDVRHPRTIRARSRGVVSRTPYLRRPALPCS
ncbi:hypothetical protein GCM10009869_26050 [Amnibacterium kyonggiense]